MAHERGSKSISKMSSEFKDWIWTKFEAQEGTGDNAEIGLHLFLIGWRGGTTFHIKTQSKVKPMQSQGYVEHSTKGTSSIICPKIVYLGAFFRNFIFVNLYEHYLSLSIYF